MQKTTFKMWTNNKITVLETENISKFFGIFGVLRNTSNTSEYVRILLNTSELMIT